MRETIARILELQRGYTHVNSPAMRERGRLVRHVFPGEIRECLQGAGVAVEGRDATGRKSKVPWVRVFNTERSPSAREGWYVVYLFHEDGRGVTLSLNQATTTFTGGAFDPLPKQLLRERVEWARSHITPGEHAPPGLTFDVELGRGKLAKAYKQGHVIGRVYGADIPSPEELERDLSNLVWMLNRLYEIEPTAPPPGTEDPRLRTLRVEIAAAAGREFPGSVPRRLSAAERKAIETHAMAMARAYLEREGWQLEDTHSNRPYDFVARTDTQEIYVEVKGTTTPGSVVILTRNEVVHHQEHYPNSCLIIVSRILMLEDAQEPTCTGGVVQVWRPWQIAPDALEVLGYAYRVPAMQG